MSSQDVDTRIILVLLLVLLLALCTVGWCALRLTILLRRPGSLQCSVRAKNARGWRTGVLILGPRALEWFSTRSFLPVPQRVFHRRTFRSPAGFSLPVPVVFRAPARSARGAVLQPHFAKGHS